MQRSEWLRAICDRHGTWLDSLLNVGGYGGDGGSASCPDDMLIIGYTAAASCYGVTHFQVGQLHCMLKLLTLSQLLWLAVTQGCTT